MKENTEVKIYMCKIEFAIVSLGKIFPCLALLLFGLWAMFQIPTVGIVIGITCILLGTILLYNFVDFVQFKRKKPVIVVSDDGIEYAVKRSVDNNFIKWSDISFIRTMRPLNYSSASPDYTSSTISDVIEIVLKARDNKGNVKSVCLSPVALKGYNFKKLNNLIISRCEVF